jgi:putative ABC transport system substrate-binding protein
MKLSTVWLAVFAVVGILIAPFTARDSAAQDAGRIYRVGILSPTGRPAPPKPPPLVPEKTQGALRAFADRLAQLGYVHGKNLVLELRVGEYGEMAAQAKALVRDDVDAIFTIGTMTSRIVQREVKKTPLVIFSCDPFEHVAQLAHPGGNVTGSTCMTTELSPKRFELLKELVPAAKRVAFFSDPKDAPMGWQLTRDAAPRLGVTLKPFGYHNRGQLPEALKAVAEDHPDAMLVYPDAILSREAKQLAEFALKQRLPTVYAFPFFAKAGGLMSYGASIPEMFAIAAEQIAQILGGARPSDVPVRRATKFHLVINMKTAKALGITVPPALLLQATEVIE